MNRRDFLKLSAAGALAAGLSNAAGCAGRHLMSPADRQLMAGLRIIDAHAHPYQFYLLNLPQLDPTAPTIDEMIDANVVCCAWAAVPDRQFIRLQWNVPPFEDTRDQLGWARGEMKKRGVRPVTKAADIPAAVGPGRPPGAILAIEGGDALDRKVENVDYFYDRGVRMMTLVHYTPNALGDIMTQRPVKGGLTRFGREVVERMADKGMIIDVAHADDKTLGQVAEVAKHAKVPVVDSHANPFPRNIPYQRSRLRSWRSMEQIAETGGVVCTWPMGYWGKTVPRKAFCAFPHRYLWPDVPQQRVDYWPERDWWHGKVRETFDQWAQEIKRMMECLGKAHVGLGTDSGGMLPFLIKGYGGYADLPKLVRAMKRVDPDNRDINSDIEAYLGGNFLRVMTQVLG